MPFARNIHIPGTISQFSFSCVFGNHCPRSWISKTYTHSRAKSVLAPVCCKHEINIPGSNPLLHLQTVFLNYDSLLLKITSFKGLQPICWRPGKLVIFSESVVFVTALTMKVLHVYSYLNRAIACICVRLYDVLIHKDYKEISFFFSSLNLCWILI